MPLDIGFGILLTLLVTHLFNIQITGSLLLLGIAFALLPDIDVVTMLWGKWKHREITHYPIVYIPIVLLVYIFFGPLYATLLFVCVYAHLIHDTFGIGWGITWFWPFTHRRFLLLPESGRRKRYGWFMTWLPVEQKNIIEEPSDMHWITKYYFRPSILGMIEYGVLGIAVIILLLRL